MNIGLLYMCLLFFFVDFFLAVAVFLQLINIL